MLMARGDIASAKPVFTELLSIEPNNPWTLVMIAKCHEHEGQFVEALQFAERAIRVNATNFYAFQLAVSLAVAAGEHQRAASHIRQALTLPEMTTEMPQDLNTYRYTSRLLIVLSRIPLLRRRLRPEKVAATVRELEPGSRAVELQQWKRWALEYLAWQSGAPPESSNDVLH